jgi:hypothetical protein
MDEEDWGFEELEELEDWAPAAGVARDAATRRNVAVLAGKNT